MHAPQTSPTQQGAGSPPALLPSASARVEGERIVGGFSDPAERARVLAWLDAGLRPGRPGRLEREYPLCFGPDSKAVPIVGHVGGEPAGFCILLPTRFELAGGVLGAGLISLVYTDPRVRGRGIARRVVRRAVTEARSRGLGLCLLWSEPGLADFYTRQGFTRAGGETLLALDRAILATALAGESSTSAQPASDLRIEPARESDWASILALRAQRICRVALPGAATRWLEIPELAVRVARRDARVVGFAMRGRGDDFAGVIHEWGGETGAVLRCCEALLPAGDEAGLLLLAPRETSSVPWRLRVAGARTVRNALAWARIACPTAFGRDLASIVPELSALTLAEIEPGGASDVRLRSTNTTTGVALELGADEWLVGLLGEVDHAGSLRARASLRPVLPETASSKLPLPLFVWGLESI